MGAKLVVEKAEMELTGGAELKMGNWVIRIKDDKMIVINEDNEYTFLSTSNGWISFKNNYYTGTLYSCGVEGVRVTGDNKFDLCFCEVKKSG